MTNTVIQEKLIQLKKHIEQYLEGGAYPSKDENLVVIVRPYIDHLEVIMSKYDDIVIKTIGLLAKRQNCFLDDELRKEHKNYKIIILHESFDYTQKLSEKRIYTKEELRFQKKLKGKARWEFIQQKKSEGYTLRDIAVFLGMNYSSLRVWISRNQEKYETIKYPVSCSKCGKELGELTFFESNIHIGEIKLVCSNCFLKGS